MEAKFTSNTTLTHAKNYNKDIGNYNVSLMSLVHTTVSYLQFMTTRMVEYTCMYVQIKTRLTEAT